jgi:hypothetical protein
MLISVPSHAHPGAYASQTETFETSKHWPFALQPSASGKPHAHPFGQSLVDVHERTAGTGIVWHDPENAIGFGA